MVQTIKHYGVVLSAKVDEVALWQLSQLIAETEKAGGHTILTSVTHTGELEPMDLCIESTATSE